MRESEYISTVDKLLPPEIYHLKLNLPYTAGVADSWYSGSRADLWIEWKYFKTIPLRIDLCSGRDPVVSRLQQDWLTCRFTEGRNVAVIVATYKGGVIYPGLTWQHPMTRVEFMMRLLSRQELALWITRTCGPVYAASEISPAAEPLPLAPATPGS